MPRFHVVAVEKFLVKTSYYHVEAATKAEAEEMCQAGEVAYNECSNLDEPGEWIETVSVDLAEDDQ